MYVLYVESYNLVLGIHDLRIFYSKVDWGFLKSAEGSKCSLLIQIWVEVDKLAACFNGLCSLDVLDVFWKTFVLCHSEKNVFTPLITFFYCG